MEYTIPYTFQTHSKLFCKNLIDNHPDDVIKVESIINSIIKLTCSSIYSSLIDPSITDTDPLLIISSLNSIEELRLYTDTISFEDIIKELKSISLYTPFMESMISYELDIKTNFDPLGHEWRYPYYLATLLANKELYNLPSIMFYYEFSPEKIISIFETSYNCCNVDLILRDHNITTLDMSDTRCKLINQITTYDLWIKYMIVIRDIIDNKESKDTELIESIYIYIILMEYATYMLLKSDEVSQDIQE
jgi:hypothetical protein